MRRLRLETSLSCRGQRRFSRNNGPVGPSSFQTDSPKSGRRGRAVRRAQPTYDDEIHAACTCRGWPTTAHPAKRLQSDPTRATHSERKLSKEVVTGTRAKSGILIPFTLVRSLVRSAVLSDRRSK